MRAQKAILGGVVHLIAMSSILLRIGIKLSIRHSRIQHLNGSQLAFRATATIRDTELATSVSAEDGILASRENESGFVVGQGRCERLLGDGFAEGERVFEVEVFVVERG